MRTPLYEIHCQLQAKMAEFSGWLLPIQYTSIIQEHLAVRSSCGVFDISHMGQIEIRGRGARRYLNHLIPRDLDDSHDGQALYTPLCRQTGGVIDDILVYQLSPERYYLVVNAANLAKDEAWLIQHLMDDCEILNRSRQMGAIAVQGPQAVALASALFETDLAQLRRYWCRLLRFLGEECLVSRTGYTGEDGVECFLPAHRVAALWQQFLTSGKAIGLIPCGLGARDTLRIEAGLLLYGHDLDDQHTPLEAGLDWTVDLDKTEEFIGQEALRAQRQAGVTSRLVGLTMKERGIPRQGYPIAAEGRAVGVVTSGSYAPFLQENIAMGYVADRYTAPGTEVTIEIHSRPSLATVSPLPFYRAQGQLQSS